MEVWGFGPQADLICATGAHRSSSSTGKRITKLGKSRDHCTLGYDTNRVGYRGILKRSSLSPSQQQLYGKKATEAEITARRNSQTFQFVNDESLDADTRHLARASKAYKMATLALPLKASPAHPESGPAAPSKCA
ncbi:hypothetical protein AK812_SmicGene42131 [Symbiodinium microadriaticum]|uniref:Uncharacterized protein n=1 Tax=Symbiodinium microadriaticum TaxID=2951 RepID=A0A1Q9C4C1_SYMMI|nr:hypothetical protein AK812_SmicGene42131 [Symbiodinium microadriaticum]